MYRPRLFNQQVTEHRSPDRPLFPPRLHLGQAERARTPVNQLPSGSVGDRLLLQQRQITARPAKP
jgi:hypothetical protein